MVAKKKAAKKKAARPKTREVASPQVAAVYEYTHVEVLENDVNEVINQLNAMGVNSWLVISSLHSGGFYRFLLARNTAA